MPQLKGLSTLISALGKVQLIAEEVREEHSIKVDWLNEKTDSYQESEAGINWQEHLDEVETLLDEIENIEIPEIK